MSPPSTASASRGERQPRLGIPVPRQRLDGRFLFVRPVDDYLTPWRRRDVIETPLDAVYDVNGWDLVKAVDLAVRGNVTVSEWLRSPIVYAGDPAFRDRLLALVDQAPPEPDVRDAALELVALKAETRELGGGAVPEPVRRFVARQLGSDLAAQVPARPLAQDPRAASEKVFRALVRGTHDA